MDKKELLRSLPQANLLMENSILKDVLEKFDRHLVLDEVRKVLESHRNCILRDEIDKLPAIEALCSIVAERLNEKLKPIHYRVINATGIILNTSLGRAPLAPSVSKHIYEGISGYCRLAAHPVTGKRYDRDLLVSKMIAEIFGSESATFCNNNAAATYLILTALTAGKEVIVSRGQLVEIGGKFRIPDVMAASGAKLVEVGATNRTHLKDYTNAITENTGAILRVHTSNYRISGFSSMPSISELAPLAHEHGLLCIDDIGSGQLVDFSQFGLPNDYPLKQSIEAGSDITCFSGDKLAGSVQAGIILGTKKSIDTIRQHPLARAFRVDKMTCLGLEASLKLFFSKSNSVKEVPTLRMLTTPVEKLRPVARRIARKLSSKYSKRIIDDQTYVGGGSLPDIDLQTCTIRLKHPTLHAEEFSNVLRSTEPYVFTRVADDEVILDIRTLLEGEENILVAAINQQV